ncbi:MULTISPECIES: DUF5666 domain-containing protein [unclassified Variovorax]|uniref:DUF5666 domain-containing protein n=1 Tax=unclassified Variovorax TaxID=663243 RepID=UPI00076BD41D|nr:MULTISPECIES: DUF5666 domain-containing protein [unclassified Variovorax]KWT91977.1 erythrocyte membrane protein 1 (PfEMP1) [Variovorax sp. WDL1]PNG59348.1 hypothetical protein CHC07_01075 [Variovorax sp. B4]PNG60861.1 hypothetical protein CHC06_00760 [Variovorax sp. B2]VTV13216.1 hypothetical protein WDL1CHR_03904 [Variovorax sp. WDL1]
MTNAFLRAALVALSTALLLSCGGGGSGGGSAALVGTGGTGSVTGSGLGYGSGSPVGGAADGQGGSASGGGSAGTGGDSTGGGGTSTASSGDDGSGVGSGGTGVSTADASGVGGVDGVGSIIVNGVRYNTDTAVLNVEDASALQLGMSAKVTGPFSADFTSGVARRVDSAADLRGTLSSVDLAQGSFVILGTTVTTDDATVWADSSGLAAILPGSTLQVWGLPGAPGVLRATRVEQRGPSAPVLTGTVQNLDPARRTFTIGTFTVDYGTAVLSGSLDGAPLANGTLVRVRGAIALPGRLSATQVQWWYPVPRANATPVQLAGIVTDYAGLGSLRVLNIPVNAASAQVTGGPAGAVGNGVKVEVGGTIANGVLQATKLKIRHVPGTGGPASFTLIGTVGNFSSAASFRVRGQPIDASGPGVVFVNGTAANLGNGVSVNIQGERVVNGVLLATRVSFE